MNNNLYKEIKEKLVSGESVVLVGPTDSGKSRFVINNLIPTLTKEGYKVSYIKECDDDFGDLEQADFVVVDEVETFSDREYLENRHPEENPYYTKGYIKAVKDWHKKLENISVPAVFIITRNEEEEIQNLVDNMKLTDWGVQVKTIKFSK